MDDHVAVVHEHPVPIRRALDAESALLEPFKPLLHVRGYRSYLALALGAADDQVVRDRGEFPYLQNYDPAGLLLFSESCYLNGLFPGIQFASSPFLTDVSITCTGTSPR